MNEKGGESFPEDSGEPHPVDRLAEEFAERLRSGESPSVDEYVAQFPEYADLIRDVFASVATMERVSRGSSPSGESPGGWRRLNHRYPLPEVLGDFRLVKEIGRGGMGIVFEAVQLSLKRRVALKVIGALPAGSEKHQTRFRREAEAAASLHHTHIVPVFGIGEDAGIQYYAMQLIDGISLADVIRYLGEHRQFHANGAAVDSPEPRSTYHTAEAVGRLFQDGSSSQSRFLSMPADSSGQTATVEIPSATERYEMATRALTQSIGTHVGEELPAGNQAGEPEASRLGQAAEAGSGDARRASMDAIQLGTTYYRNVSRLISNIADALAYAHHQGILHRDIKPGNLLLDRDGMVWITDFGLARRDDYAGMTQTGEIVGTLRYMAPEQMRGTADPRTDVFSLGLTLYELLTLRPAIERPESRWIDGQRGEFIVAKRSFPTDVPLDLQTITMKACAVEPGRRYASARAFQEDLRRFLEDRPILARRTTHLERLYRWARRNPAVATLSAITGLLFAVVAIMLAVGNQLKQKSLDRITHEFNRAEENLKQKTEALLRVEAERQRAENNLELAIQAFDQVIDNITARGGAQSLYSELDEVTAVDEVMIEASLSQADVVLLEALLGFFDRFAIENTKDLTEQSASARKRVGDIEQRLGRLQEAEATYSDAFKAYQTLSRAQPDEERYVIAQADILNELMAIHFKRGELPKALERCQTAKELLEQSEGIRKTADGRFSLAKTLSRSAASSSQLMAAKFLRDPRPRSKGFFLNRNQPPPETALPPMVQDLLVRDEEANSEAIELLRGLIEETPTSVAYRLTLARAFKEGVRIARMMNDWPRAETMLEEAITLLEELGNEYPESNPFKFELADTLSLSSTNIATDMRRFLRSMQLCEQLIAAQPEVPEYRFLLGQTYSKLAVFQWTAGRKANAISSLSKATDVFEGLVKEYPDVLMYVIRLGQSLQQLSDLHLDQKQAELAADDLERALKWVDKFEGPRPRVQALLPMVNRMRERKAWIESTVDQGSR